METEDEPMKESCKEEEEKPKKGPGRRGKAGIKLDHSLLEASRPKRERRSVQRETEDEKDSWNFAEKEKLLDALYRHSHLAYESIAHVIKSKTPKQVERFIQKTLNSSYLNYRTRLVEADPERGAAPLELWLSLVHELVTTEKKLDHSKHYTEIFKLIGQNEPMPDDSGFPGLNWRNLYQFISDLLADKAVLQPLSSMESMVLLDMMHSMGDTLHASDTIEQRRLLDLKYQLFKWQTEHHKDTDFVATYSAINNDYSRVEYRNKQPDTSTSSVIGDVGKSIHCTVPSTSISSSSSSSSHAQPCASSVPNILPQSRLPSSLPSTTAGYDSSCENGKQVTVTVHSDTTVTKMAATIITSPLSSSSSLLSTVNKDTAHSTSISLSKAATSAISTSIDTDTNATSMVSQPPASQFSSSPFTSANKADVNKNDNRKDNNADSNSHKNDNSHRDIINSRNDDNDEDADEEEDLDPLPKLFSLNPFTIPPSLLHLQPNKKLPEFHTAPIVMRKKE